MPGFHLPDPDNRSMETDLNNFINDGLMGFWFLDLPGNVPARDEEAAKGYAGSVLGVLLYVLQRMHEEVTEVPNVVGPPNTRHVGLTGLLRLVKAMAERSSVRMRDSEGGRLTNTKPQNNHADLSIPGAKGMRAALAFSGVVSDCALRLLEDWKSERIIGPKPPWTSKQELDWFAVWISRRDSPGTALSAARNDEETHTRYLQDSWQSSLEKFIDQIIEKCSSSPGAAGTGNEQLFQGWNDILLEERVLMPARKRLFSDAVVTYARVEDKVVTVEEFVKSPQSPGPRSPGLQVRRGVSGTQGGEPLCPSEHAELTNALAKAQELFLQIAPETGAIRTTSEQRPQLRATMLASLSRGIPGGCAF